jgi:hypothetical protein
MKRKSWHPDRTQVRMDWYGRVLQHERICWRSTVARNHPREVSASILHDLFHGHSVPGILQPRSQHKFGIYGSRF